MKISYGSPGARGVTKLMAVGDDGAFAAATTWDLPKVAKLGAAAVPSATATDLAAFLRKGTSAGVRSIVESSTVADADSFAVTFSESRLDGKAGEKRERDLWNESDGPHGGPGPPAPHRF